MRATYKEKIDQFVSGLKSLLYYESDGMVGVKYLTSKSYFIYGYRNSCDICGSNKPLFVTALTDGETTWWCGVECEKELKRRGILVDEIREKEG